MHGIECGSRLRLNWNTICDQKLLTFLVGKVKDDPTKKLVRELQQLNGLKGKIEFIYFKNATR